MLALSAKFVVLSAVFHCRFLKDTCLPNFLLLLFFAYKAVPLTCATSTRIIKYGLS